MSRTNGYTTLKSYLIIVTTLLAAQKILPENHSLKGRGKLIDRL